MASPFEASFAEAGRLLDSFRSDQGALQKLDLVADWLTEALRSGHKALACGNGGSMADAMHFAEEWTGKFRAERDPYPVLALSDPTHMSCTANDFGFDEVFARGVRAFGGPGDLLFVLSTSGNSTNLVRAVEAAKDKGVRTIGFLGKGGGKLAGMCDLVVMAPGSTSDRIQELHMLALHTLIEVVEQRLVG